jgi:DNA-binding NarL/FixJ family response regulator
MSPVILVSDDHKSTRKGLWTTLYHELGYRIIDEARSLAETLTALHKKEYSHLILDVNFGDGTSVEIIPSIRALHPKVRIAIVTMVRPVVLRKMMKTNGLEYIIHKSDDEGLSPFLTRFLTNIPPPATDWTEDNPFSEISSREIEVLYYLMRGEKTTAIAALLNLSQSAVSTLKMRLREKTNSRNDQDLIALARAWHVCAE